MSDDFLTRFPKSTQLQPLRLLQANIWQIIGLALITGGMLVIGWGGWLFYQEQAELTNPPARIVEAQGLEEPPVQFTVVKAEPTSTAMPSPSPTTPRKEDTPPPKTVIATMPAPTSTPPAAPPTDPAPSLDDNPLVVAADVPTQTETIAAAPVEAAVAPPTRITIASINLDAPVVETGWKEVIQNGAATNVWVVADYAAGWHKDSKLPGQGGNIVLSGHHNIKGEVFRYIVDLKVGDVVSLYVGDRRYDYEVNDKFIVKDKGEPDAVRRANARWIGPFNEERLTLITCWPYNNNTHRVIVIAKPIPTAGQ